MEMTAAGATGPEFLTSHCMHRNGSVRTGTAFGRPGLVSTESQSFQNPRPLLPPHVFNLRSPSLLTLRCIRALTGIRNNDVIRHLVALRGLSAVADNTLTIKQKSTLPVSKTRQDKSLFRSLSGDYLPPQTRHAVSPRRQREHRAFVKQCPRPGGS